MTTQTEAQRLADDLVSRKRITALEKLLKVEHLLVKHGTKVQAKFEARITALEQANKELLEALQHISLCSQNSMSSQRQCGEIARAAIAKATGGAA
jgi:hypothetical protein